MSEVAAETPPYPIDIFSVEDAERVFGRGSSITRAISFAFARATIARARVMSPSVIEVIGPLYAVDGFVRQMPATATDVIREAQAANRRAWRERVLVRLASPTEDDRVEAAMLAAWMRATPGYVLPLP